MDDSNESTEYILLTKSEYIDAQNFPSQAICQLQQPDKI